MVPPQKDGGSRFTQRAKALLRDVALQATVDIVRTRGWAQTRMADIATLAGISKPTLYKYFGSRDELARAYVDREVDLILQTARSELERYPDDPERALTEGLRHIVDDMSRNPLIRAVLTDDAAAASATGRLGGTRRATGTFDWGGRSLTWEAGTLADQPAAAAVSSAEALPLP